MNNGQPFEAALPLDQSRMQLLVRALDTYVGVVYLRAQEARSTGGRMLTHLNEGLPLDGLDADRLFQLGRDAEQLVDELLKLVPDDARITAVFEDGTPMSDVTFGAGDGPHVLLPASTALTLISDN